MPPPQLSPVVELVGGPYDGMVLDTQAKQWRTVCINAPVDSNLATLKITPVSNNHIEVDGSRGAWRYRRIGATHRWMVQKLPS